MYVFVTLAILLYFATFHSKAGSSKGYVCLFIFRCQCIDPMGIRCFGTGIEQSTMCQFNYQLVPLERTSVFQLLYLDYTETHNV